MKALPILLLCLCITSCNKPDEKLTETPRNIPNTPATPQEDPIVINPSSESTLTPTHEAPPKIELKAGENVDLKVFGLSHYPSLIKSDTKQESSLTKTSEKTEATLTRFTKDSPSKVAEFYSDQITSNRSKSVTSGTAVVGGITKTGAKVFIVATKINDKTQLSINASLKK